MALKCVLFLVALNVLYVTAADTTIEFEKSSIEVSESDNIVLLTVQRTGKELEAITKIKYATKDGSAKAGSDFVGVSGWLMFMPGETSKAIPVQIIDDDLVEADECFEMVLSDVTVNGAKNDAVQLGAKKSINKVSDGICIMEKPSVSYSLGRHMLILNVGGFHLNPKNNMFYNMFHNMYFNEITVGKMVLSSRSSVLQSVEEKCKCEISLMKTLRGDGGVTVYNTFKKLRNPLSVLTESEIQLIESINIRQQLPLYESIIRSLLKVAKVRSELVTEAQEWFTFITSFSNNDLPALPEEMSFQIVSCLNNSDLKQLIQCGEKLSNQMSTKGQTDIM